MKPMILVQLFNAKNHAIGITPVREIDDVIAEYFFDKLLKNGYVYVPDNIDTE